MNESWNHARRALLGGGVSVLAVVAAPVPWARSQDAGTALLPAARAAAAAATFAQLEAGAGGRIGLAALDLGSGARLSHRGGERFAMCSTFKWLLAAAVLARQDAQGGVLDQHLHFSRGEVLPHSPVTSPHGAGGERTIRVLCAAAVEDSDNTATCATTAMR
jgi:beta-lactamase class A